MRITIVIRPGEYSSTLNYFEAFIIEVILFFIRSYYSWASSYSMVRYMKKPCYSLIQLFD